MNRRITTIWKKKVAVRWFHEVNVGRISCIFIASFSGLEIIYQYQIKYIVNEAEKSEKKVIFFIE